jgi:DNA-binding transcriptional MerR regulator
MVPTSGTARGGRLLASNGRQKMSEVKKLTESQARELIAKIQKSLLDVGEMIVKAFHGQAWLGMGYESWAELCEAEFPRDQYRLRVADRRALVAHLRDAGLTVRDIAKATNDPRSTVQDDIKHDQKPVRNPDKDKQGEPNLHKATKPAAKKKDDHYDWEADKVELVQPKPVDLPSGPRMATAEFTVMLKFPIEVNLDSVNWAWANSLEDAVKEEMERIKAEPEAYLGSDRVVQVSQRWL